MEHLAEMTLYKKFTPEAGASGMAMRLTFV
jgi:hypothetical protein